VKNNHRRFFGQFECAIAVERLIGGQKERGGKSPPLTQDLRNDSPHAAALPGIEATSERV
jgi:hypothetical protein